MAGNESIIHFHNLMSGAGFEGGAYHAEWYMAWAVLGLLVIIGLLFKKWLGEEGVGGFDYNYIFGFVGGILPYFLFVSFTGLAKIGLIIGLVGMIGIGVFGARYGE